MKNIGAVLLFLMLGIVGTSIAQKKKAIVKHKPITSVQLDNGIPVLKNTADSLVYYKHQFYLQKDKIRREQGYIDIVVKNPSQVKFLKGWSIRDGIFAK